MFEEIKNHIHRDKGIFVYWLVISGIEFTVEAVEWYTVGHENDFYEIDIWPKDHGFFQVYYDKNGFLTRYEIEEDN